MKGAYELFGKVLKERVSGERKDKLWNPHHKQALAEAARQLEAFDDQHSDPTPVSASVLCAVL